MLTCTMDRAFLTKYHEERFVVEGEIFFDRYDAVEYLCSLGFSFLESNRYLDELLMAFRHSN